MVLAGLSGSEGVVGHHLLALHVHIRVRCNANKQFKHAIQTCNSLMLYSLTIGPHAVAPPSESAILDDLVEINKQCTQFVQECKHVIASRLAASDTSNFT